MVEGIFAGTWSDTGTHSLAIICLAITLGAYVYGLLGFGIASISVPIALTVIPLQVFNPAIVLIELVLSVPVIWLNIKSQRFDLKLNLRQPLSPYALRVIQMLIPGTILGACLLKWCDSAVIKPIVYALLLPLTFVTMIRAFFSIKAFTFGRGSVTQPGQLASLDCNSRKVLRNRASAGGFVIGFVYGLTTICGPLLVWLYEKHFSDRWQSYEFRLDTSFIRLAITLFTLCSYIALGFYSNLDVLIIALIATPAAFLGANAGHAMFRKWPSEKYRKIALAVNFLLVIFGVIRSLPLRF